MLNKAGREKRRELYELRDRALGVSRLEKRIATLAVILIAVGTYAVISVMCYAFRHPELTDTQRLLNIVDALLWR